MSVVDFAHQLGQMTRGGHFNPQARAEAARKKKEEEDFAKQLQVASLRATYPGLRLPLRCNTNIVRVGSEVCQANSVDEDHHKSHGSRAESRIKACLGGGSWGNAHKSSTFLHC